MASPSEVSTVKNSPFRFLDLPFELRREIIRYAISIHHHNPTSEGWDMLREAGFEIEGYDFIISAAGLRCPNLTSFSLCLVNKQVRQEALSIIFQNATVCLHVQVPRYGPFSEWAASVPTVTQTLNMYPLLCDMAQEVTIIVDPEPLYMFSVGLKVMKFVAGFVRNPIWIIVTWMALRPFAGLDDLAGWVYRAAPFCGKRHADLQALVDTVLHTFKTCKHLKIMLRLENLNLQDVKIILGLFNMPNCTITLEEWWRKLRGPTRQAVIRDYETRYKNFVRTAAEESGHKRFLLVCPSSEEIEVVSSIDGDIGKRRRVWFG